MYTNRNIGNFAPGRKLIFIGFIGKRPAKVAFALEKSEAGFWRLVDILHVPVHHKPTTRKGYNRTKRWARQRVLETLEMF